MGPCQRDATLWLPANLRADFSRLVAKDIKTDTSAIRDDTAGLKLGQEQILAKIEELHAQLPQNVVDPGSTSFVIQRYLDSLTSYTESVCDGTDKREEDEVSDGSRE